MRHNYFGLLGPSYIQYLLIGVFVVVILVVIVFRKTSTKSRENSRLHDIVYKRLKVDEIAVEEYDEINAMLEDESSVEAAILVIKERYAYGDLNLQEYLRMIENVKSNISDYQLLNSLKLKYAIGEINEHQYKESLGKIK